MWKIFEVFHSKKKDKMKDGFGIEIPCDLYNMTDKQVKSYLKKIHKQAQHDLSYCQDDPGGYLTRQVDKMYQLAANLEFMLVRRENESLKKELALKTPIRKSKIIH